MSNCHCGCHSCGDSKPRVNGTEVTILSGTQAPSRANGEETKASSSNSKNAMYVLVPAVAVAVLAFVVSKSS